MLALALCAAGASAAEPESAPALAPDTAVTAEADPGGAAPRARPPVGRNIPDVTATSAKMLVALAAILGIIYGLRWAASRFGTRLPGLDPRLQRIRVLSVKHLAPKRSLALVEVEGRQILVGVGAAELRTLAIFSDDGASPRIGGEVAVSERYDA